MRQVVLIRVSFEVEFCSTSIERLCNQSIQIHMLSPSIIILLKIKIVLMMLAREEATGRHLSLKGETMNFQ